MEEVVLLRESHCMKEGEERGERREEDIDLGGGSINERKSLYVRRKKRGERIEEDIYLGGRSITERKSLYVRR